MPTNVPDRKNIERGLAALQAWRRDTVAAYRVETDPEQRRRLRQLVDDLEWLCWRLEQVLDPMSENPPERGRES